MSSDISRQRFNPTNDFQNVLMQQGRVQIDAEWNEWNEILDRRWRSETIDIIGRCVVPLETPDGFEIQLGGGGLTIGRGRIYVHGLQAENHGAGDLEFDAILAESRGLDPLPYDAQPYYPNPEPLPEAGGPHLVYLDVWEREVTSIEEPELVENAVGVDTTTRLQTAWQVRVLPGVGDGANCATPDEQLEGWLDIIRPSAGRLTSRGVGVATSDDPCLIPPSGNFRGNDNRTYRVEINDGGAIGSATFKWSRDNASVASGVSAIEGDLTLTVDRAVWDSVRRFSNGDWIEITDDWREFSGQPGEVRQIDTVDESSRTITLKAALTAGLFPVDGQNLTDPERHTRIKRWDQDPGGPAVIDVPAAGTPLVLEDGVEITFSTDPDGGEFRFGDYWIFVARTADASVEELTEAPPRGVHHHYCRLAVVTMPDVVIDCRTFWPPSLGGEESCDCTICVTAEEHNQGVFTIQQAVNQILTSGGTVCLGPGIFNLNEIPVQLGGAFAVRIRGQGAATIVIAPRSEAAFIYSLAQWCTLDYLTIQTIAGVNAGPAIRLSNSVGTTIERLIIGPTDEGPGPFAGVLLGPGFLLQTKIRDNFFRAQNGVTFAPGQNDDTGALFLGAFYCERNLLQCSNSGIALGGSSYYISDTVLARNFIFGCAVAGISATGFAFPELEICANTITPLRGDGIVVGTGGVRISDNCVANFGGEGANGIRLVQGLIALGLTPVVVRGNRLQGLRGDGLSFETALISALVEHNVFNGVQGNGIIMQPGSAAGSMKVLGNELVNIAVTETTTEQSSEIAAILLRGVFEGAISDNAISAVGTNSPLATVIAGIRVDNSLDVRVNDNAITNVAPATQFSNTAAGIMVVGPIVNIEIADNLIKRQIVPNDDASAPWQAIRIAGLGAGQTGGLTGFGNLTTIGRINAINAFVAATVPANEQAGIVGNSLHGYGRSALAEVQVTGSCRFSDNHCACSSLKVEGVALLTANSIIAGENRVECGRDVVALNLKPTNGKAVTVLGNIVGGPIVINGSALGAPWQPLNVIGA